MPTFKVTMQFHGAAGSGEDRYTCATRQEADAKFTQCRDFIIASFEGDSLAEIVDETDFFGIIDHNEGAWAKVFITANNE
ncbi:MAG: hypothetical protein IK092_03420 [Muribaculaceae bacterium]|nr:hypothetical protein [Muribaculaceae bacterium]